MPRTRALPPALVLAVALVLTLAPAAHADGYFHVCGFASRLGGSLTDQPDDPGERVVVDFDKDIDFDIGLAAEARAGAYLGRHRFSAAAASFEHEASRSAEALDFAGTEFSAEAHVTNRLRWAEVEYGYAVVANEHARFELLGGVRLFDYLGRAEGTATSGGITVTRTAEVEETGPVPHLGASIELRPAPHLVLRGIGRGFTIGVEGTSGQEVDLEGTLGYQFTGSFELGGGLRWLDISIDSGDTLIEDEFLAATVYVRWVL